VDAPDAVNVVELPLHMVVVPPIATVGVGLTVRVTVAGAATQPAALVPVTV
jgi:hypothetical protein